MEGGRREMGLWEGETGVGGFGLGAVAERRVVLVEVEVVAEDLDVWIEDDLYEKKKINK